MWNAWDINHYSTAGTNSQNYMWHPTFFSEPHCAKTECGKLCHKGINCMMLKDKKDDKPAKIYCKECDFVFESDLTPCEDKKD